MPLTSSATTVCNASAVVGTTGTSDNGANMRSASACAGLAKNQTFAPPPAVTIALTKFCMSTVNAFSPPPAVGEIGVTPLSNPAGRDDDAATLSKRYLSKVLDAFSEIA